MKRISAFILIIIIVVTALPSQALARPRRAKDGTAVMTARSPEQMSEISRANHENMKDITIDSSDGSLEGEDGSMEDVIPMSKSRRRKLTKGNRRHNRRAIRNYLEDKELYNVSEEKGDLKVSFPFSSQRIMVVSSELTETCDADTAVYYEPRNEYVLTYDSQESTKEAYETYREEYGEDQVFLDLPVHADSKSWGLEAMNINKIVAKANVVPSGHKTLVALIDSGVNSSHAMFSGRTFSRKSKSFIGSTWKDDYGHGTHTAGILAEGTSKEVEFLVLKVLDKEGNGSVYDVLLALDYAVRCGADVANLSLGLDLIECPHVYSSDADAYKDTRRYFYYLDSYLSLYRKSGLIMCGAAGNNSLDIDEAWSFPAKSSNIICVGAASETDKDIVASRKKVTKAPYSNYGASLDFVAPGEKIKSAYYKDNKSYITLGGTSMASPHVAAAATMIKVYHPSYNFDMVFHALKEATGASSKINKKIGYGVPILSEFKSAKAGVTRRKTSLARVSGVKVKNVAYNKLRLRWNKVKGARGYVVYQCRNVYYQPVVTTKSTSAVVKGLTCGKKYRYKVVAFYTSAKKRTFGPKSGVVVGRPVPAKTTKVVARPGKGKITFRWRKVAGATGYLIYRSTKAKGTYKRIKQTTSRLITDKVKRKKKYYYRIRAYRTMNRNKKQCGKSYTFAVESR